MRDFYGRSLDWFLDRGWLAAPDHSGLRSRRLVFLQAITLYSSADWRQRRDPRIFHCAGGRLARINSANSRTSSIPFCRPTRRSTNTSRSPDEPGLGAGVFTVLFLKDANNRQNIEKVAAELRKACSKIPGVFPTLNPQPVLQINIGATGSAFGRYSYVLSGINPEEVYAAADKLAARLSIMTALPVRRVPICFRNTPESRDQHRPRTGRPLRRLDDPAPKLTSRRIFPELRLPDQGSRRPIPGDRRGRRQGASWSGRSSRRSM